MIKKLTLEEAKPCKDCQLLVSLAIERIQEWFAICENCYRVYLINSNGTWLQCSWTLWHNDNFPDCKLTENGLVADWLEPIMEELTNWNRVK